MSGFSSQKPKLAMAATAFSMMLLASLVSPTRVSSNQPGTRAASLELVNLKNPHLIQFKRGWLDTRAITALDTADDDANADKVVSASAISTRRRTRVIQFAAPPQTRWIERLRTAGLEIVGYIPNNAYVVRGSAAEIAAAAALHGGRSTDEAHPIRWMGRFDALYKIDPAFGDELLAGRGSEFATVEIEVADSAEASRTVAEINGLAININHAPRRFLNSLVLSVTLPVNQLTAAASFDDVLFIGPAAEPKPSDERSAQIVAGNLIQDLTQPVGPGYRGWLQSKGLDTAPDFLVDIADTGLDRGFAASGIHPDLRDDNGVSRVSYSFNYANDAPQDQSGHGSLVASIVAGKGSTDSTDYQDSLGNLYGLGVDPSARLGISRIFNSSGKLPFQFSFSTAVSPAYAAGARISNGSWGNTLNAYDATAREYDILARDAQPFVAGNQEMVFVFSAGNGGPGGHISSPGSAKNVITVAASENYRPEGFDSCNLDGEGGIGPDGADSALDILRFSSGGPLVGGRMKPDLAAPGTHIYGGASRATPFFGDGLCPGVPFFQPPNQTFYTWSSGTSMAAPHVTGAAALVRRFFTSNNLLGNNRAPSPAMTKAFLINSATYMTGQNAGGDLPGDRQGWGLVDLSRAFDSAKRVLLDQSTLFTETGQTYEIQGSIADRSLPLRATLTWTDAPGMLAGPTLVNDLDLEIKIGGVTVYRGNHFQERWSVEGGDADRLNNVESIILPADAIPAGVAGNFTITVRAASIVGDGVPGNESILDQDFALVVYNVAASVIGPPPPPPKKTPVITAVTYIKKRIVIIGQDFTAAAQVEINGKIIDRSFEFDPSVNSLSLKLKYKKLKLVKESDNQIVLIENGERSLPFVLRI